LHSSRCSRGENKKNWLSQSSSLAARRSDVAEEGSAPLSKQIIRYKALSNLLKLSATSSFDTDTRVR